MYNPDKPNPHGAMDAFEVWGRDLTVGEAHLQPLEHVLELIPAQSDRHFLRQHPSNPICDHHDSSSVKDRTH
eukprot:3792054-Rhodomonas_salina.1